MNYHNVKIFTGLWRPIERNSPFIHFTCYTVQCFRHTTRKQQNDFFCDYSFHSQRMKKLLLCEKNICWHITYNNPSVGFDTEHHHFILIYYEWSGAIIICISDVISSNTRMTLIDFISIDQKQVDYLIVLLHLHQWYNLKLKV